MKLMIIDDEPIVRLGLERIVTEKFSGLSEIRLAEDGDEALQRMETWRPDVCIVDIRMRHMSGIDLIRQAQQKYPGIRYIVLSGYADFQYAQELMELGCRKYLTKPVSHEKLLEALRELQQDIAAENEKTQRINRLESASVEISQLKREQFIKNVSQNPAYPQSPAEYGCYGLNWLLQSYGTIVIGAECRSAITLKAINDMFTRNGQTKYCVQELTTTEVLLLLETEDVYSAAEQCCQAIARITEAPFSIGTCSSATDVHTAIASAEIAMQCCFSESGKHICHYEDITIQPYRDFAQQEHKIRSEIIGGGAQLSDCIEEMLNALQAEQVRSNVCSVVICRLYLSVRTCLNDSDHREVLSLIPSYRVFEKKLQGFHAFSSMKSYVQSVFFEIERGLAANSDTSCRRIIQKGIYYVEKNYAKDISLTDIAEYLSINPSYFSQLFKRETGKTYMRHLTETRITQAKHLLLSTQMKVYHIGQQVGYSDSKYFSRIFRQMTGVTPAKFRETCRNGENPEQ